MRHTFFTALLLACALMLVSAAPCMADASAPAGGRVAAQATLSNDLDDYDTKGSEDLVPDPLEGWNRFWFGFNDILLLNIAKPLYKGYEFITPQEFRTGVSNFFHNLAFPLRFINCLLQGKPMDAGVEMGRFIVNSTVGFAGLIDVAKKDKPVVQPDPSGEDFGQTLGTWGVGEGFYIVWPGFGPSSLRDTVGIVGDYAADPLSYPTPRDPYVITSTYGKFNNLGSVISNYETIKKGSVEPYSAIRNAYIQNRRNAIAR